MTSVRSIIGVLVTVAGLVQGKAFSQWQPAKQTLFQGRVPLVQIGEQPVPTTPPDPSRAALGFDLYKRQGNQVCGYIQGNANNPFKCPVSTLVCSTNQNYVGCCPAGASCLIYTACLDNSVFSRGACSSIGSQTTCCSNIDTAFCNVFTYVDLPYQSVVGCGSVQGDAVLYANPVTTCSTSAVPSSTTTTPVQSSSSDPNFGAIIGGVIGGVAILAIAGGLIAWYVIRKREKRRNFAFAATAVFPSTHADHGASPMGSPGLMSETAHSPFGSDHRHSMLKTQSWHGFQPVSPGLAPPPQYNAYSPYGDAGDAGGSAIAEADGVSVSPVEIGGAERQRDGREVSRCDPVYNTPVTPP
ncbi:hypothetical protein QBC38DRAFT_487607 [Podospora fimiseda]|uniref:Mid2 domain-containing protein n=1 Tax=Podospora fimiseda TaxID=252190 RepID=A0AAN7BHP8_9PEZI|nr:hypothetical protein QBC38DRAFT_487607 [Podospora fimiseda]